MIIPRNIAPSLVARFLLPILLSVIGCANRHETPPPASSPPPAPVPRTEGSVVRSEAQDLQRLANRVQTAPDGIAEAEALRQLRQYLVDHRLLYRTGTARASDGRAINNAAVRGEPLRATVEVLRGEQPVYTFAFVPKDNRNLTLIGAE